MQKRTTDLDSYEAQGFTWGIVLRRWDVGPYTLLEYHPWKRNGVEVLVGRVDYDLIWYNCYVGAHPVPYSADSIERALAICMAYKFDGQNSQAAEFFMRMIQAD